MNRRLSLIACILAALGAGLILLYLQRYEREMSGGERVALLSVLKPVARGTAITEAMLTTRWVPLSYVEERAVRSGDLPKVLGIKTALALEPQQSLLWTDLALGDEPAGVESLIAPGRRAVSVRAGGLEAASVLIRPGHHVDVIHTTRAGDDGVLSAARVLLQNVVVLAVGSDTRAGAREPAAGTANRDGTITLSLSLEEAQLIALALERGRLTVALRNPRDPGVATDIPSVSSRALGTGPSSTPSDVALSGYGAPKAAAVRPIGLR